MCVGPAVEVGHLRGKEAHGCIMLLASVLVISCCLLSAHAAPPVAEVQGNDNVSTKSRATSQVTAEIHTDHIRAADNAGLGYQEEVHVTITYSIWVGTNVMENYTLVLQPVRNTSFYDVMILAASVDEHYKCSNNGYRKEYLFTGKNVTINEGYVKTTALKHELYRFEATEWPYGHYITMLAGHREDPANYLFWLIYQTPQLPDPASPPGNELLTPVGVDSLYVDDGDNYLFWLRNL